VQKILKEQQKAKSASKSGRQYVKDDSHFLVNMTFQNHLPAVPSGPFFKKVGISHTFAEFAQYRTSSLEKSYVWEPHFGPDVNIRLDLVDQDAILDKAQRYPAHLDLDKETKAYTSLADRGGRGSLSKKRESLQSSWWLRETVYNENSLFKSGTHGTSSLKSTKAQAPVALVDPFSVDFIQQSFDAASKPLSSFKELGEVEWSMPILPHVSFGDSPYSWVRFDEDPAGAPILASLMDPNAQASSSTLLEEDNAADLGNQRKRVRTSLLTNAREKEGGNKQSYAITMIVPTSEPAQDATEVKYEWLRDFHMNIAKQNATDSFVLLVDEENQTDARMFLVSNQLEMGKLQPSEIRVADAHVTRQPEEAEEDEEDEEDA